MSSTRHLKRPRDMVTYEPNKPMATAIDLIYQVSAVALLLYFLLAYLVDVCVLQRSGELKAHKIQRLRAIRILLIIIFSTYVSGSSSLLLSLLRPNQPFHAGDHYRLCRSSSDKEDLLVGRDYCWLHSRCSTLGYKYQVSPSCTSLHVSNPAHTDTILA